MEVIRQMPESNKLMDASPRNVEILGRLLNFMTRGIYFREEASITNNHAGTSKKN